jgi:hypothetical protein
MIRGNPEPPKPGTEHRRLAPDQVRAALGHQQRRSTRGQSRNPRSTATGASESSKSVTCSQPRPATV